MSDAILEEFSTTNTRLERSFSKLAKKSINSLPFIKHDDRDERQVMVASQREADVGGIEYKMP